MFVALKYVTVDGQMYSPGEIIEKDPNAEWHLKKGAIKPFGGGAPEKPAAPKEPEEPAAPEEPDAPEEPEEEPEAEPEEPEAPEIDVTEALVEPKSAQGGRKKAAR